MNKQTSTAGFMAMKGAGYYSKATIGAKHVMDNASGLVLDAIARMDPADDGSIFRVTDMGAADGGTSGLVGPEERVQGQSGGAEQVYGESGDHEGNVFRRCGA